MEIKNWWQISRCNYTFKLLSFSPSSFPRILFFSHFFFYFYEQLSFFRKRRTINTQCRLSSMHSADCLCCYKWQSFYVTKTVANKLILLNRTVGIFTTDSNNKNMVHKWSNDPGKYILRSLSEPTAKKP